MLNKIITVDPGLNTGIALWRGDDFPATVDIICPARLKDWKDRLKCMWDIFNNILSDFKPVSIFIEETVYYETDEISRQAMKRGDLFHLNGLSFGYAALCIPCGISADFIPPFQWKGQMSKQATADRIFQINGVRYSSEHITDAVGIGFGIQKRLVWRIEK